MNGRLKHQEKSTIRRAGWVKQSYLSVGNNGTEGLRCNEEVRWRRGEVNESMSRRVEQRGGAREAAPVQVDMSGKVTSSHVPSQSAVLLGEINLQS